MSLPWRLFLLPALMTAIICGLALAAAAADQPPGLLDSNLLQNPGFEGTLSSWSFDGQAAITSTHRNTGCCSASLTRDSIASASLYQEAAVTPGATYSVAGYYYLTSQAVQNPKLVIDWLDADGTVVASNPFLCADAMQIWQSCEGVGQAALNAISAVIRATIYVKDKGALAYVDDMSFVLTAPPAPTVTATRTSTASRTRTGTSTRTRTATATLPVAATATQTTTATGTPSRTATATSSATATHTRTETATATATSKATLTPSPTVTATQTEPPVPTATMTAPATETATTPTPTETATATGTVTPTQTETATGTITAMATQTEAPVPSATMTVTATATTATPAETETATATETAIPPATGTATPIATDTPTSTATAAASPPATATQADTATPSTTQTAMAIGTATRTRTPTRSPTSTRTATATRTPPTATRSATASPSATATATATIDFGACRVFLPVIVLQPTPTATPTATPNPYLVTLNEILPNPYMIDWNGDGKISSGDEWVELYNRGSMAIDVSGWVLDDEADAGSQMYFLPAGTVIQPHGFLLFFGSETGLNFANTKEVVRLLYRNGVQLEQYRYYATWHDRSFSKTEDGGGTWTIWYPPTPGEPNHP